MSSEEEDAGEVDGPEIEVWNHLESGLDHARMEWRQLDDDRVEFYERSAEVVLGAIAAGYMQRDLQGLRTELATVLPELERESHHALFHVLMKLYGERIDPWLRFAVELRFAEQGVASASEALDRLALLAPQLGSGRLPDRTEPYLREAIGSFLFGFEAACVSMCRSALEQVARDVLVNLGVYTEPGLKRDGPDLETLLIKLRAAGALREQYDAADRVRARGNTVLHKHMYEPRIQKQMALLSLADLMSVLKEVLP